MRHDDGGACVQVRVRQVEVEVARLDTSEASDPTSRAPRRRFCSQSASEGTKASCRAHPVVNRHKRCELSPQSHFAFPLLVYCISFSSFHPFHLPLCSVNTMSPKELRWGILATGKISTNFSKVRYDESLTPTPTHAHTTRSRCHPRLTPAGHPHRPVHSRRLGRVPPDRGGRFSECRVGAGIRGQAAQARCAVRLGSEAGEVGWMQGVWELRWGVQRSCERARDRDRLSLPSRGDVARPPVRFDVGPLLTSPAERRRHLHRHPARRAL